MVIVFGWLMIISAYSKKGYAVFLFTYLCEITLNQYIMIGTIKTYWSTIKIIGLCALVFSYYILYTKWQNAEEDNERNEENMRMEMNEKETGYKKLVLDKNQMIEYLNSDRSDLANTLKQNNIKVNRIESLLSQVLTYRDTSDKETDLTPLIEAINKRETLEIPFSDTSKCLTVEGNVKYENNKLKINITNREFNNKTDVVAYWKRKEWKFLFWKTRFLGKKEITAKSFSECGEVGTVRVEKAE
jgi:hypothetical protein